MYIFKSIFIKLLRRKVSVIIRNENEFNHIKRLLKGDLYLDYVPQMGEVETGIIFYCPNGNQAGFSVGSVGKAAYQKEFGFRLVNYDDFIKFYT